MWKKTGTGDSITQVWKLHNDDEPGLKFSYNSSDKERLQQICDCLNEHLPKKEEPILRFDDIYNLTNEERDKLVSKLKGESLSDWSRNEGICWSLLRPAIRELGYAVNVVDNDWTLLELEGTDEWEISSLTGAEAMSCFYIYAKQESMK